MLRLSLLLLLGAQLLVTVTSDLPLHCLHSQAVGTWLFKHGSNSHDDSLTCGHKLPDAVMTMVEHHIDFKTPNFVATGTVKITLSDPDIAMDSHGNKGTWTMIYDEAMEIVIDNRKWFTFFKYQPKPGVSDPSPDAADDFDSFCDETFTGWYHDTDGKHWGCFIGKKEGAPDGGTPQENPKSNDFLELGSKTSSSKTGSNFFDIAKSDNNIFIQDADFVERVNRHAETTWSAKTYKQFEGKTMKHMRALMGGGKFKKHLLDDDERKAERESIGSTQRQRTDEADGGALPKEWDWRSQADGIYKTPVVSQGSCGSCYAIAAADSLSMRLRILSHGKDKTILSAQNVVSCSDYNQGCEGGYPFLVGKFGEDIGFIPDYCEAYTGDDAPCKADCGDQEMRVYHAQDYHYIGGFYGACNEKDMMEEIFKNGPIVIAINAPPDLFYYSGGVYQHGQVPKSDISISGVSRWEKTNHAVACVGWGVADDGMKYWIIKNSWGQDWGEDGYFKLKRGSDEIASESMAVAAMPLLPEK